jgi:protoporphyrinogen oxidase
MQYDIIIIGAGPSGLTIAQTCSSLNLKILVIDKNDSIGGCHRVKRVGGYFTEHGPRIYSSAYLNFMMLLEEMNVEFDELFIPYNFQFTTIGQKTIFSSMNFHEFAVLFFDFINLIINEEYGEHISMKDHLESNNFSKKSKDIIDKICRLTDGADISRYSLNEFLQLVNQQFFYKIYQPKMPNDIGLFKIWKTFLQKRNVSILLNTNVETIEKINNVFTVNVKNNNKNEIFEQYSCNKVIIAAAPLELIKILEKSNNLIKNAFGKYDELKCWAESTNYNIYIQITFHWNEQLKLDKVYGFPASEWGVAFITLSDYMKFEESKTVMSTAVTITDKKSNFSKKTANESSKDEIINEVFRVLQLSYPTISNKLPNVVIFNPTTKYINNKWISEDTAFISSSICKKDIPFESENINGLYNVGTHNNKHFYKFTSLESAVTNALFLSYLLYPELEKKYVIKKLHTVRNDVLFFIVFCVIVLLGFFVIKIK